jgi:hypothetical protein
MKRMNNRTSGILHWLHRSHKEIIMIRSALIACLILYAWPMTVSAENAAIPDQIEVKYNFVPGRAVRSRMTMKSVGSTQIHETLPEQKMTQTFEIEFLERCLKVNDDGLGVFEMGMPVLRIDTTSGNAKFRYASDQDSVQTDSPIIAKIIAFLLKPMTKMRFRYTMKTDGEPVEIEGLTSGIKKILNALKIPEIAGPESNFLSQITEWVSDEQMMERLRWDYRMTPHGGMRVGDEWEHTWENEMPPFSQKLTATGRYKLLGIERFRDRLCARITLKETYELGAQTEASGNDPAQPMLPGFEFESNEAIGEAWFDIETWDLIHLKQIGSTGMTLTMPSFLSKSDNNGKTLTIKQNFRTAVTIDLVEVYMEPLTTQQASPTQTQPAE